MTLGLIIFLCFSSGAVFGAVLALMLIRLMDGSDHKS